MDFMSFKARFVKYNSNFYKQLIGDDNKNITCYISYETIVLIEIVDFTEDKIYFLIPNYPSTATTSKYINEYINTNLGNYVYLGKNKLSTFLSNNRNTYFEAVIGDYNSTQSKNLKNFNL